VSSPPTITHRFYLLSSLEEITVGLYSTYAWADENIAWTNHYFLNTSLPVKWENTEYLIGSPGAQWSDGTPATTAPNALGYGGWYSYDTYNDIYDWLPGGFAMDLDSVSFAWGIQHPLAGVFPFATEALAHGGMIILNKTKRMY
jgi:hypothetical protein